MLTQTQYDTLVDRLRRVGLGSSPAWDSLVVGDLSTINEDPADPLFERLNDRQFAAYARPVVQAVERDQTRAEKRTANWLAQF